MISEVQFIKRCTGSETSNALRKLFSQKLEKSYGIKIPTFDQTFTFLTDYTSTIPAMFGAPVSFDLVSYSKTWLGCISHQLNTAMKHSLFTLDETPIQ